MMRLSLCLSMAVLCGCAGFGDGSPGKSDPNQYSLHFLKNMEYSFPDHGKIKLTDGVYQEKPSEDSATYSVNIKLERKLTRFGDVVERGSGGAAMVLSDNPGGSGTFYYLAVVAPYDDKPHNVDTVLIGDRLKIDSLSIVGRRILVDTLEHAPEDPRCCPTVRLRREYKLVDGRLKGNYAN